MDNATLAAQDDVQGRSRKARAGYAFVALAAAFAVVIVLQSQAAEAQFGQVFCQVILSVYNAFANSPFFGFIQGVLEGLLQLFNCVISPGA